MQMGKSCFRLTKLHNLLLLRELSKAPSATSSCAGKNEFGDVFWDQQHPDYLSNLCCERRNAAYG